jgi:hypothetical protein
VGDTKQMKNNFNIEEFLAPTDFNKAEVMQKLENAIIKMQEEGLDLEEALAFVEGSQYQYPSNIPLFKLWTKRIWQKLEEKSKESA